MLQRTCTRMALFSVMLVIQPPESGELNTVVMIPVSHRIAGRLGCSGSGFVPGINWLR